VAAAKHEVNKTIRAHGVEPQWFDAGLFVSHRFGQWGPSHVNDTNASAVDGRFGVGPLLSGATGTPPNYGSPTLLIDGTGLLGAGPVLTRPHNTTHTQGWLKNNTNPANNLIFQMPGARDLSGAHIWQYSQGTCCTGRGVSSFDMHFSFDGGFTYPTTLAGLTLAPASGTSQETAQTLAFAPQIGVTHVKFDNMTDFPSLPNPGWQGLNEVRFEAAPVPLTGTPIGNALTPRAAATDGSTQVLYTNFTPMPADGEVAGVSTYAQGSSYSFNMYQLRPTGTPNQYDVVYDSGTIRPSGGSGSIEALPFPNGPTTVAPGDVFAHYGRGIPYSDAGGTNAVDTQNIYYPSPSPPSQGSPITLGGAGFPQSGYRRDYAWAVDFQPGPLPPVTNGLMAYWDFDDVPSATFDYDDRAVYLGSGDVDDSTFTGNGDPTRIAGKVGAGALDLDGNDVVYANYSQDVGQWNGPTNITTGMSVQAWVRMDSPANNQDILAKRHTNNTSGWVLETYNGNLTWWLNNVPGGGGWNAVTGTGVVTDNLGEWTHLVLTWESGDRMRMYVNGGTPFESAGTVGGTAFLWDDLLGFGAWAGIGRYFDGALDEVAIWNRQLSADEVAFLYNGGQGRPIGAGTGIIPEPAAFLVWSLLAALGIGLGWRRRKA